MPEFIMPGNESPVFCALSPFVQGYIEAMFFTESGEPDSELRGASFYDFATQTLLDIEDDCAAFQAANDAMLTDAYHTDYTEQQAGRDYWFTRNGHGVGYWDRNELQKDIRDSLTAAAKDRGGMWVCLGDDGDIYCN